LNSISIKFLDAPVSQSNTTDVTSTTYQAMWNTSGIKNYRLIVNNGGCIDSADFQITVNEIPIAAFTQSDNVICLGEQVDFTFTGTFPSANPLDIAWDFDGAATATGQTPSHIFATIGTKTITLIVTNGACQDVFTRTVQVEALPDFTLNIPANICANRPFDVSVTNNGAGVFADYNFNWNHGIAAVSAQGNETYELLYTTPGADNISVTITNNAGCELVLSQAITVDPSPTNSLIVDTEVCVDANANFQYSGATTGVATVNWDFGNGTATGNSVTNSWNTAGTQTVTVTVSDATTCLLSQTFEVEVIPNPTADVTPITEACLNSSFLFEYLGTADPVADSFTWTFSDLANATVSKVAGKQAYNVSYATLGIKTITINVLANGCPVTISHDLNIVASPDFTVDLSAVCTGDITTFYTGISTVDNIDPGSGGTWVNNGGASINEIVWTTAGVKNIVLTLSTGNCTETRNFTLRVNPTPSGLITLSNGCAGETIFVTYGGVGAASIFANYDWGTSFNDATSVKKVAGQEAYEVIWDTPGTYNLAVTVTEDGCSNTISLPTIEISEIPIADFDLQATNCSLELLTIDVIGSTVGYVYNWDLDAGGEMVSANADSSSVTVTWQTPGDKIVTLFTTLGSCTVSTNEVIRILEAANPAFDVPFFCFDEITEEASGTIMYTGGANLSTTTFDWDFNLDAGLGETAIQIAGTENYDVVYKTPGFKVISLTVTNPQCGARTFVDSLAVNNLAEFTFDAQNNSLCQGATAVFTFTGAMEPGATLSWDFDLGVGDDSTEVVKDSVYEIVYNLPGLKTISLQINGVNCGSPVFTDTFNVGEAPTSAFRLGSTENCLGDTTSITHTGKSTATAVFNWDFADGVETAINDSTYTVIWPTPGSKDIRLFIEDGGCFSDTTVQTIRVNDNTALDLYIDNNLCIDSLGLLTIDTTFLEPNATWNWTFNDDAQIISDVNSSTQIEFRYPTSGQKSIRLQVIGDNCEGFDTTMVVNVGERIPFDIAADTKICSNDSSRIVFNLPIVNGRSLTWDFGVGSSFTKISTNREDYYVKWDAAGIKNIDVAINNGGCIIDSSFQVNVTQLPDAAFQMANFLCQNDTLYAYPDWPISPFTILTWTYNYNGVNGFSTNDEFTLPMADEGNLSLTLSVLENGCMDTYTSSAVVRLTPLAAIDAPELICLEGTAMVSFSETIEPGASFDWGFGEADRVVTLGNETYELGWDVGGDKNLWVVSTLNGCPSDTAFHKLNVFSVDNLQFSNDTICQHQTVIVNFIEESVSDNIDSWDFDGGQVISGDVNSLGPIELFYSNPGNYTVTLNLAGYVCGLGALSKNLQVDASQIPSLSIEIPPLVCRNTDITLALNSTNGGDSAVYEYFINSVSIGNVFDSTLLRNRDIIKVVMTSSAPCAIFPQATSNEVVANISDYRYTGNTYANPNPVCIGDPTTLSLDPGNYRIIDWESSEDLQDWMSEGNNDPDFVTTLNDSRYFRAVIIDISGVCTLTTPPVLAEVVPYNPINAGEDRNIREGNSLILEATKGMNFIWKNNISIETDVRNSRIQVKPLTTTIYTVEGLTLEGCPDNDSVTVIVRPAIAPPNVFSPNSDGVNDTWLIDQIGPYPDATVAVYDRWGKKLFSSIGYNEPWGGIFNGEIVAPGVYYYVIDLKDGYNAVTGTVTVLY
ncbi:MAG: gliding motility-associated-like protein, partial [Marivirga sp.]